MHFLGTFIASSYVKWIESAGEVLKKLFTVGAIQFGIGRQLRLKF